MAATANGLVAPAYGVVSFCSSWLSATCDPQVFCYALSPPDGSEWRTRIEAEVEHFTDVSSWSIPDIAARISADQIQVRPALPCLATGWCADWCAQS